MTRPKLRPGRLCKAMRKTMAAIAEPGTRVPRLYRRWECVNNHAFQRCQGVQGNYYDVETGEEYWISGVKRNGQDRHWAGSGKVIIDRKCIDEYLSVISMPSLPDHNFIIEDIEDSFPVDRINKLLNEK